MAILKKLQTDLITALKSGNQTEKGVLRFLLAAIKNAQIEKQGELSDQEVLQIIRKQIKKEEEELEFNQKAGRPEVVEEIKVKIDILKKYLPPQLSKEEIKKKVLSLVPADQLSPQNFGQLMGRLVKEFSGQVDNSQLAQVLKELINEKKEN